MSKKFHMGDIRVVIGIVLAIIGLFLIVCGFTVTDAAQLAKSDHINANLWSGLGLFLTAVVFFVWTLFSPQVEESSADSK